MKPSQGIFAAVGLLVLVFGFLYIIWPIAPYHEEIIGMTYEELSTNHPAISGLMTALVNVVGLAFLALGVFVLYLGLKAWDEVGARIVLLVVLVITVLPLAYVVYATGGPWVIMLLVSVLNIAGIISSQIESQTAPSNRAPTVARD